MVDTQSDNHPDERRRLLEEFAVRAREQSLQQRTDPLIAKSYAVIAQTGIQVLLLKGPGTRDLAYPGLPRGSVDCDLLISPADDQAVTECLTAAGFIRVEDHHAADDLVGVLHSSSWTCDGYAPIDLHHQIPYWQCTADMIWELAWRERQQIDLDGVTIQVPSAAFRALHIVTHTAQDGANSRRGMTDLTQAISIIDLATWQAAAELAKRAGATEAFSAGLRMNKPAGVALAEELEQPEAHELSWRLENLESKPRGFEHLQAFTQTSSLLLKAKIVVRAIVPPGEWLRNEQARAGRKANQRAITMYFKHWLNLLTWTKESVIFKISERSASKRINK